MEWQAANSTVVAPKPSLPKEHWLPPEEGWVKAKVDGAMSKLRDKGGTRVVLQNHHGMFLVGVCHFFPMVTERELAELLACHRAIKLVVEVGVQKLVLESDSEVVNTISSVEKDLSHLGLGVR